jgi:thioredoxin reductase
MAVSSLSDWRIACAGKLYDLIIVGGGPDGLSAGIYALRAALTTILIEKGLPGGKSPSPTPWRITRN